MFLRNSFGEKNEKGNDSLVLLKPSHNICVVWFGIVLIALIKSCLGSFMIERVMEDLVLGRIELIM